VYELASVTKPFTATAMMLLVEDGALRLDDPITDFFPEAPSSWNGISIRHLLSHTSGIPDYFNVEAFQLGDDFAWRLDFTHEEFLRVVREAPLDFAPGTSTAYSNTGYSLLGILIERVTDRRYEDVLARRIFEPLGMTSTRRNSRTEIIPGRAAGYVHGGEALQNAPYTSMTWAFAEGGLVSSARDLARWDQALTDGEILSPQRLEEMWNPPGDELPAIGLGWTRNTSPAGIMVGHSGGKPGFATYHARFLDLGTSVILLANQSGVPIIDIGRGLAGVIAGSPG
jgi:CubicO group peptidase (beta-lactamase class C family)